MRGAGEGLLERVGLQIKVRAGLPGLPVLLVLGRGGLAVLCWSGGHDDEWEWYDDSRGRVTHTPQPAVGHTFSSARTRADRRYLRFSQSRISWALLISCSSSLARAQSQVFRVEGCEKE